MLPLSPNGHSDQEYARLKPESRGLLQVSCEDSGVQPLGISSSAFSGILAGSWIEMDHPELSLVPVLVASVVGGSLTLYTTVSAPSFLHLNNNVSDN